VGIGYWDALGRINNGGAFMKQVLILLFSMFTVISAYAASEQIIGPVVRVQRTFTINADALFSNCKLNAQSRLICEVKEFDSKNSVSGQAALRG
jgi:hypothetical protein